MYSNVCFIYWCFAVAFSELHLWKGQCSRTERAVSSWCWCNLIESWLNRSEWVESLSLKRVVFAFGNLISDDNSNVTNILFLQCHNFTLFYTLKRERREGNPEIEGKNSKKERTDTSCISSFIMHLFISSDLFMLSLQNLRLSGPMSSWRPFASQKHNLSLQISKDFFRNSHPHID